MRCLESQRWRQPLCKLLARQAALAAGLTGARQAAARLEELLQASRPLQQLRADLLPQPAGADGSGSAHSLIKFGAYYRNAYCPQRFVPICWRLILKPHEAPIMDFWQAYFSCSRASTCTIIQ